MQEDTYYPFGLTSSYVWVGPKNLYLQNGKELQEDGFGGVALALYYYAARMYDATIGRFVGIDPLADDDPSYSPYAFCGNNPANFFDPDGLKWKKWNWKKIIKIAIIVVVAVAVVAVIAAVPVIVCPGTALASFVGGGTGATTLGAIAGNMLAAAGQAIIGGGAALGGALVTGVQAVGAKVGAAIAVAAVGAVASIFGGGKSHASVGGSAGTGSSRPLEPGRPTSPDCGCGKDVPNPLDGWQNRNWDLNNDGILQWNEAAYHYQNGNGTPITVRGSSIDLTGVDPNIFSNDQTSTINLFFIAPNGVGAIYGQVEMQYLGGNKVQITDNDYDFDTGGPNHPWTGPNSEFWRNVFTFVGNIFNGPGTPYKIIFDGPSTLSGIPK